MAKILKMNDGKKYKVIEENGKYYICENTQFRKSNPNIVSVEEVEEKDKPKKKTTAKKSPEKKKGE